jgi:hypothetical protein
LAHRGLDAQISNQPGASAPITQESIMYKNNVFDYKSTIECWGIWYALWLYGFNKHALWTIFVATRMIKRDRKQFGLA